MIITKNTSLLEKKAQNFEANFCLNIQMLQWDLNRPFFPTIKK
jgi:hypothetical protein